jgi:hypothetical protein
MSRDERRRSRSRSRDRDRDDELELQAQAGFRGGMSPQAIANLPSFGAPGSVSTVLYKCFFIPQLSSHPEYTQDADELLMKLYTPTYCI